MRIALVGGSGRIGRYLLRWALSKARVSRLVAVSGTRHYRVRPDYAPRGGGKIARADVAHFATAVLTEGSWVRERPALAY